LPGTSYKRFIEGKVKETANKMEGRIEKQIKVLKPSQKIEKSGDLKSKIVQGENWTFPCHALHYLHMPLVSGGGV
jgi:hypothetical protein